LKQVFPWGVNVPFTYLAFTLWGAGAVELILNPTVHPYLMMLGAYSLYFGMVQRLFFPVRRYLPLQILSLAIGVPLPWAQVVGSAALLGTEVWSLLDVRSYGSRYPLNLLVLSSVPMSLLTWIVYGNNFWVLVVPLLSYLLGVNEGILSSNLKLKPRLGLEQVPLLAAVILCFFFPVVFPAVMIVYALSFGWSKFKSQVSALLTLAVSLVVPIGSWWLGNPIHAFTLGVMSPMFASCVTYSISRENYGKEWPIPLLFGASFFLRNFDLILSGLPWVVGMLFFMGLVAKRLDPRSMSLGL